MLLVNFARKRLRVKEMDEQRLIDIEIKATEAWFKSSRFRLTKRPYTAQDGK
jgi:hypothetical protein